MVKIDLKYSIAGKITGEEWPVKKTAKYFHVSVRNARKVLRDYLNELDNEIFELQCDRDTIAEAIRKK